MKRATERTIEYPGTEWSAWLARLAGGAILTVVLAVPAVAHGQSGKAQPAPEPTQAPAAAQPTPRPVPPGLPSGMGGGGEKVPPEFLAPPTGEKKERLEKNAEKIRAMRSKSFEEMLEKWLTPKPYPKSQVVRIDKTHAYPHPAIPWKMEIVKEDKDTVWLRGLPPEDPESAMHKLWLRMQQMEIEAKRAVSLAEEVYYLEPIPVIQDPPSVDRLRFERLETNLPEKGRWRMNMAFGDFNGDGIDDMVTPPPRKGGVNHPLIFLGDRDGGFAPWQSQRWDTSVRIDYGGVGVADFDGDGHLDVVIGVHFGAPYVFYGDGRGNFGHPDLLPRPDPRLSSRAPAVADFDGDGRPDVAFVAEAAVDLRTDEKIDAPSVWVCLNGGRKHWKLDTKGLPEQVIADNLAASDLNGDGRPDLLISSSAEGWRTPVFLNEKDGWEHIKETSGVLSDAYHFDELALPVGKGQVEPEIVAVFEQFYPTTPIEGSRARTGVIVYGVSPFGIARKGTPLLWDDNRTDPYFRVASGDLDGDGHADLVVARKNGAIRILLADPSAPAGFVAERGSEISGLGRPYDIAVRDVNGDGFADVLVMAAPNDSGPGGISVWLTRRAQ